MALREVADVIAFDQRGTGQSSPAPRCRYTDPFPLSKPATRAEASGYVHDVARYCLEWWTAQGVDITTFNTRESAHDLEALRRALGAEKLNLWGISYGTHLALEAFRVMGRDRIHRAVLASPEGLSQTVKLPAHSDAYFERVAELARDEYPDLLERLRGQMKKLETPVPVEFTTATGETVTVHLGPFAYRLLIAFAMVKNPSNVARLPEMVYGVEQAGFGAIAPYLGRFLNEPMSLDPMSFGMDVASGVSPAYLARVEEQARSAILGDALNYPMPHVLGVKGLPDLGDDFRREVETEIETLVLTGTLDGRTFPEAHAEVLAGLSKGRQIVIENAGHDLFMVSPEVQEAVVRFFRDGSVANERISIDPPAF
jgi:pimeloyl-ACP methyl ester carboxylesterase